jgi:nicotinamide-nucleotide amidase
MKVIFTGVPKELIDRHGAVSAEVAEAMAKGIRQATGASLGLSVTGIAGPTGGTEEKPVGLVYISLTDGKKTETLERRFSGPRDRVREFATLQALDMVRRKLR